MKRILIALLGLSVCAAAQTSAPQQTEGTVFPVVISKLQPIAGSLAQVLLQRLPVSANVVIGGVLSGFSFDLTFNGTTASCAYYNADPSGNVNLSCVAPTLTTTPAPATSITRLHQGAWGNLTPVDEGVAQSLGWTVAKGNFLVAFVAGSPGATITGATAYAGTTAYPMLQAACYPIGRQPICLYYLPNAPAVSSIDLAFNESATSTFTLIAAEYNGLSSTAAPIDAGVVADSGYQYSATWTAPQYVAPAGSLVLAGAVSNGGSGTWTAGPEWSLVSSYGGGTAPEAMLQDQAPATSVAVDATGSFVPGYQYFDSIMIAFK